MRRLGQLLGELHAARPGAIAAARAPPRGNAATGGQPRDEAAIGEHADAIAAASWRRSSAGIVPRRSRNRSNVTSSSPAAIPRASAISRDSQRATRWLPTTIVVGANGSDGRQCLEQRTEEQLGPVTVDRAQHRRPPGRPSTARPGTHSNRAGQPPGSSPSTSSSTTAPGSIGSASTTFARRTLTLSIDEVRALVEPPPARQEIAERQVAHRDDVERAVVDLGVRRDHHRAAEVAAVRDRDRVDRRLDAVACRRTSSCTRWFLYDHVARAVASTNDSRPSFLPDLVDQPIDDARHAERRDVREHPQRLRAVVARRQLEPPDVDLASVIRARSPRPHRRARVGMFIVRRKSPPVPNGISAKLASGLIARALLVEEAVDDLVDRAVAADRDDPLGAAAQRLAREPRRIARALRCALRRTETRGRSCRRAPRQRLPSRPPCDFGLTMTVVRGASTLRL